MKVANGTICLTKKGIHFNTLERGCSAFWQDFIRPRGARTRRWFFGQIISGWKLILKLPSKKEDG